MTLATKALIKQCCAEEHALIEELTSKLDKEIENDRKFDA